MTLSTENSAPDAAASGEAPASQSRGFTAVKRFSAIAALMLVASSLSGCGSTSKGPPGPCPMVKVLPETEYLTKFGGNGTDLSDIAYEAQLEVPVEPLCWYSVDESPNYIRTAMQVKVNVSRGPKFSGDHVGLKYFVAITGPAGARVKKELFDTDVDFSKGQVNSFTIDVIDPIKIFPKEKENGDFYRIYVGFDLTKEQLDYNKRNPRR